MNKFSAVVFCSGDRVLILPDGLSPEEYAGFMSDDLRVYISRDGNFSDESMQVLSGYEHVNIVDISNLGHIRPGV